MQAEVEAIICTPMKTMNMAESKIRSALTVIYIVENVKRSRNEYRTIFKEV